MVDYDMCESDALGGVTGALILVPSKSVVTTVDILVMVVSIMCSVRNRPN